MELKVFTLNCWGIAYVSRNHKHRIQAIAETLAVSNYDFVCLQEIWVQADYNLIKDKSKGNLPYSHYFHSGVVGSGICIFSRYPFKDTFFHQWPVNGYIHKLHHGDWFGGKGVGLCHLKVNNYKINIYSAHLHAEYDRNCDEYQAHRVLQAYDTAQFILMTSGDADLVLLAGDLNTEPGDLAYRIILSLPGFRDAFSEISDCDDNMIATNESLRNSYTPAKCLKQCLPGKRIDYIMYHAGPKVKIDLKRYCLPLPDKVPEQNFSFSDHEAVAVTLNISPNEYNKRKRNIENTKNVLEESIKICDDALKDLSQHRIIYILFSVAFLILLILTIVFPVSFFDTIIYQIIKITIAIYLIFTFVMATIWNSIEYNALIAARLGMKISLNGIIKNNK